jgi:hypothetical protein
MWVGFFRAVRNLDRYSHLLAFASGVRVTSALGVGTISKRVCFIWGVFFFFFFFFPWFHVTIFV